MTINPLRDAAQAIVDHELFYDREYLSAELNEKLDTLRRAILDAQAPQAEPMAWTGSGSMMALRDGREGYLWPTSADAHPIPLYLFRAPQPAPDAVAEAIEAEREACAKVISDIADTARSVALKHGQWSREISDWVTVIRNGAAAIRARSDAQTGV